MNKYLREHALHALLISNPKKKAEYIKSLQQTGPWAVGADVVIDEPVGIPGRPLAPQIVAPQQVKQRGLNTLEGRAIL